MVQFADAYAATFTVPAVRRSVMIVLWPPRLTHRRPRPRLLIDGSSVSVHSRTLALGHIPLFTGHGNIVWRTPTYDVRTTYTVMQPIIVTVGHPAAHCVCGPQKTEQKSANCLVMNLVRIATTLTGSQ